MTSRSDLYSDGLGPFCKRTALVLAALGFIALASIILDLPQTRLRLALLALLSA